MYQTALNSQIAALEGSEVYEAPRTKDWLRARLEKELAQADKLVDFFKKRS